MSQTAPSAGKTGKQASSPLVPPDERFWKRYSPHGELPLSSAGSLVLHVLAFGLLVLMAWLSTALFGQVNRKVPVEAVRLDLSGGGGHPHGVGDDSNNGPALVESGNQPKEEKADSVPSDDVPPPKIHVNPAPQTKLQFDEPTGRRIQDTGEASKVLMNLRNRVARIQPPGSESSSGSGHGQGGTGRGGGSGDGVGRGIGNGTGAGEGTFTQREKRMLRWSMLFNTTNSADYVAQLRGLGAILAIPVREDPQRGCQYKIVRDLSTTRPAKLLDEDINSILRMIRWIDDKPESVLGVMSVLRLPLRPSHFLAFMPEELEQKLLRLEIEYLHKRHPNRSEEDIEATKFRIKIRNGKYEPEVCEQKLK